MGRKIPDEKRAQLLLEGCTEGEPGKLILGNLRNYYSTYLNDTLTRAR